MNHKKIKKSVATAISGAILSGVLSVPVFASTNTAVSLGYDLTNAQKEDMLKEFGISKNDGDVKIINITVDDIREQLGLGPATSSSAKGNSYSSSYVEIQDSGYGIKVSTNNLTEVTGTMLQNALLTSGITDANVKASSPFPVTGTAALAGILKGFEDVTGEELSLNQKEVAKEEISVTNTLSSATTENGNTLGKDEAALVINEIKTQIIKDSPKTDIAIDRIVTNIVNNYNITLTPEEKSEVVTLMSNINDIGFDYSEMKNSLKQMANNLKTSLDEAGKNLKESGILEKTWNKVMDFTGFAWDKLCNIGNKVKGLIVGIDNIIIEKNGVQYDINGNMLGLVDDSSNDATEGTSVSSEDSITDEALNNSDKETSTNKNISPSTSSSNTTTNDEDDINKTLDNSTPLTTDENTNNKNSVDETLNNNTTSIKENTDIALTN